MLPALLALLSATAAAPSPDERPLLDAFKSACERTGDMAAMKADALAAGWEAIPQDKDPRIANLLARGRAAIGEEAKVVAATFRRTEGGREIFLIQSRFDDDEGYWGVGCRSYDFAATAPLPSALLEAWMGMPPTGVEEPAPGLVKRLWEPAWRDGVTLEVSHVAPGNVFGQSFGLQGNIITAQAIGGF
jgi:hypothetical protein